jgi:sec-independent protein translocase protein TatB
MLGLSPQTEISMFNIGWSEMVVIGVVALIAIGPKELPGVLRTMGQWAGKARRMATEFQNQFNEALREAEMADLKKSFDDVSAVAKGLSGGNILSSVTQSIEDTSKVDQSVSSPATSEPASETVVEAKSPTPEIAPLAEPQESSESGKRL